LRSTCAWPSLRPRGELWSLTSISPASVREAALSALAMSAGMLAAAYVDCAVGPDTALALRAAPLYEQLYREQYARFHEMAKLFYASNATVDSYFWEARRILGERAAETDSDRMAFVRAVAGQSPLGYERAVLAQGRLPGDLDRAIAEVEADLAARRHHVRSLGAALGSRVASLAPGVSLARDVVLDDGRFAWGDTLSSPTRPEKVPLSPLVAAVLRSLDGRRTLGDVVDGLAAGDDARRSALSAHLPLLVETLFADGAIELS
jgi:hypothetical protein